MQEKTLLSWSLSKKRSCSDLMNRIYFFSFFRGKLSAKCCKTKEGKLCRRKQRHIYTWGRIVSVLSDALLGYSFRSKLLCVLWSSNLALLLLSVWTHQAFSAPVTRLQKATMDSWIRFKLSAGSVKTLDTSEETQVASQSSGLGLVPLVLVCWHSLTTQRVRTSHQVQVCPIIFYGGIICIV